MVSRRLEALLDWAMASLESGVSELLTYLDVSEPVNVGRPSHNRRGFSVRGC